MEIEQQKTSIDSYRQLQSEGKEKTQTERVLKCIEFFSKHYGGATDKDISNFTKLPMRQSSTRRRLLVKQGKVRDAGTTHDSMTAREVILWKINENPEISFAKKSNSAKLKEIKELCVKFALGEKDKLTVDILKIINEY